MDEQRKPPANIFVVVDPSQEQHVAFDRAIFTANSFKQRIPDVKMPKIHVFLSVDMDNVDTSANQKNLYRDSQWFFERFVNPLAATDLEYSIDLSWSSDWYGAIVKKSTEVEADIILLPLVHKLSVKERLFNESVWHLLRTVKCPILVCRPGVEPQRKNILAAVNFQSDKPEYQRLNDLIIAQSRTLAGTYGAQLHIVNAYRDSLHYPDRGKLSNETQVPAENIHVNMGSPEDVIAKAAKDVSADIVVLGMHHRARRWRGGTAEKIINKIDGDILTIN